MKACLISTLTTTLAICACSVDTTGTQTSFVYENFVGEGRPEYVAIGNQIELRAAPNKDSAISNNAMIQKEGALSFENSITRALNAGQIEVISSQSVQVREFGEIKELPSDRYYDESITWVQKKISASDKPRLLMWIAEGHCLVAIGQTVNELKECPTESSVGWRLVNQPATESWIEVNINDSKGWVKVDGQQIKEVSRIF